MPSRPLPNGRIYCVELAATEGAKDRCALDLEENVYTREEDRKRALGIIERGLRRIELMRKPCNVVERTLRFDRCDPKIPL